MTDCECQQPGYCVRHGMHKSAHLHHLCQTDERYFRAWEAGRGPGQGLQPVGTYDEGTPADADVVAARRTTCVGCGEYMGDDRCKRLELGCARMYRERVTRQNGKCPQGKWSE